MFMKERVKGSETAIIHLLAMTKSNCDTCLYMTGI